MTDKQVADLINAALKHSNHVTVDFSRNKLGKSMKVFDHSNNVRLGTALLYNSGLLRKYPPAKLIGNGIKFITKKGK